MAALIVLALVLRGAWLGRELLWIDEAESTINALTILDHGVPVDHHLGLPLYENTLVRPWPRARSTSSAISATRTGASPSTTPGFPSTRSPEPCASPASRPRRRGGARHERRLGGGARVVDGRAAPALARFQRLFRLLLLPARPKCLRTRRRMGIALGRRRRTSWCGSAGRPLLLAHLALSAASGLLSGTPAGAAARGSRLAGLAIAFSSTRTHCPPS